MSVEEMVEFCIAQGNKLAGAQVYYREDWDCYYFDIAVSKVWGRKFYHFEKFTRGQ